MLRYHYIPQKARKELQEENTVVQIDNDIDSSSMKSGNSFGVSKIQSDKASENSSSSPPFSELVGLQLNSKSKNLSLKVIKL